MRTTPNKEAVRKHHEKANVKCEWIIEDETAKTYLQMLGDQKAIMDYA